MLVRPASTQDRVDACQELPRVEGLGKVVIRAHLQADDPVDFLALCRQHDDGGVVVVASHPPTDRKAIFAGQHQVKHQQVDMLALPDLRHIPGILGDEDVETLLRQVSAQEIPQARIVVDDQNFPK